MRIAVLESDIRDAKFLEKTLRGAGYTAQTFTADLAFTREFQREPFDLIMVGSVPPDARGTTCVPDMRANLQTAVPIIRLLKKNIESDVVAALNAGADDCMVQPLRSLELLARVAALIRRTRPSMAAVEEHIEIGALRIDLRNRLIARDGVNLKLTPKSYDLAVMLLTHTGQLLTRTLLLERVWGHERSSETRTLDTHMSRLRSVLGLTPENGWKLQSVYQHGYRLDRLVSASTSERTAEFDLCSRALN